MNSYFQQKPTDCSLFSEDGHEFPIHKELLCQTKFLCHIVKSTKMDCYGKLEIILPSISGNDLENIVTFLYSGRILCTDPMATSKILSNLTDLLGFPESMELSGAVKDEIQTENQDMTYEPAYELNNYESPADYLEYPSPTKEQNQDNKVESGSETSGIKHRRSGDCPHCGQFFLKLKMHIENKHSKSSPWKCHICDFSHHKNWGLQQHIRNNHQEGRPVPHGTCQTCGKFFKKLALHMTRTHASEKNDSISKTQMSNIEGVDIKKEEEDLDSNELDKNGLPQPDKQLWKLVGDVLKNKAGFWESTDSWSLPSEEGIKGNITNCTKNTVLGVISNDTEQGTAVIEDILVPNDVRQIWIRGKSRPYFTLLHPNSGKYLTASPNCLTIEVRRRRGRQTVPKHLHKVNDGLCPHCGEYFKLLRQHIMYKHETNKPWKCDKCDFSHAIKSGLDQHKGYYHPTENGLKVCDICGYSTPQLSNLKDHMGSVHAKKKNFTCNVCEKQFYAKRKMEKHIKTVHLGERNFECKLCNETFRYIENLHLHTKKVHEGIKFKCNQCSKELFNNRGLKRHLLKSHGVVMDEVKEVDGIT